MTDIDQQPTSQFELNESVPLSDNKIAEDNEDNSINSPGKSLSGVNVP